MSNSRVTVFVYGTLKRGHYNHRCISMDSKNVLVKENAAIRGTMYDLGPYPAVAPTPQGVVRGEVWLVTDETFKRLDHLEGYPDFYDRILVPIDGEKNMKAWVYVMHTPPQGAAPVPEGIWQLERRKK